jgi:signal transduction histidine kinase
MWRRLLNWGLTEALVFFIALELIVFSGSALLALALYLSLLPSSWMLVLAVICLAQDLALLGALRLARLHRHVQSVTLICVASWISALLVTFVAPILMPWVALAVLLPVSFAERCVRGKQLLIFILLTAACLVTLGALAGLHETAWLSDEKFKSVGNAVLAVALPVMVIGTLLVVSGNAATLRNTAKAANRNAAALRTSEQLLAEHASELAASRTRVIAAADDERRRLERDLHDGAQQDLVALAVLLQLARTAEKDRSEALLLEASELLQTAIAEIRRLAHGIYPPLLISGGLAQALPAAAAHAAIPVDLNLQGLGRYPTPIECALYYCSTEALQNAAKHGGPDTKATITARADDHTFILTISDTGRGFNPATDGTGLTNMTDRLAAIGGHLEIDTAPGRGTRIIATLASAPLPNAAELAPELARQHLS